VPGTLFVVATPLGNLEDLSPRAQRVLREAACIACEDTRRTSKLLARFGLDTPTLSCHKFNERERLEPVLKLLGEGKDVALVSDGGTPGVSDPGALLVRAALDAGFPVSPVPGPSAPAALLSASGLSADRFVFEGFLPHRAGERRRRLRDLRSESRTVVFLEAPHRIRETLEDLEAVLGPRTVVLGRELTKAYETLLRGTASQVIAALGDGEIRGEITLAVAGAAAGEAEGTDEADSARLRRVWAEALEASGGDRREALRRAARTLGTKRPELWRRLTEIGEPGD
jgi:16S rRNA (cytidine1402-2'-O)-methyltransferase